MQKFLFVILVLLLAETGITYAQDPGIPDTVNFGVCQSYIVAEGDSFDGKVRVPLRIFNDEPLENLLICLTWNGPIICDTGFFYGQRLDTNVFGIFDFDNEFKVIGVNAFVFEGEIIPDTGVFLYIVFQAFDTGVAKIDTRSCCFPECPITFADTFTGWRPPFEPKEFELVKSDTIPGDLNGSSRTDLVDIIILVNFTFKSIYQGFLRPAADVNSDCRIRLSDVIYLINFIFKAGERPKPGCAF
ncbi:MAG: hypothetical protein RBG1_1C00001G0570 [candidate division Zixibacteria bacterium RBG-1]|nr:MAG: hypothetical protein RBG1_1C00001G0570 [candidate division Zixibacteria bacterium RBG-1]OGC83267.1 MAG: hypothetical protein A2V73_05485 [candidate division Zixibacteria bacterium RBG_19FT_COMBO_42_43]